MKTYGPGVALRNSGNVRLFGTVRTMGSGVDLYIICLHVSMNIVANKYVVNPNDVDQKQKGTKDRTLVYPILK